MPAVVSMTVIIGLTFTSLMNGSEPKLNSIGKRIAADANMPAQSDCDITYLRNEPLIGVLLGSSERKKPPVPITAASSMYMFSIWNHI